MANITYTRQFQHTDWQDNVDRVQAGGPTGFNQHFHDIEGDFDALAQVVSLINAALIALGQQPPPSATQATIAPALVAASSTGWQGGLGVMSKPANQTSAWGAMSVDLPNGAVIQSFRATGRNTGAGSLRVALQRQGVVLGTPSEQIGGLSNITGDPFDQTTPANAAGATVNNQQFKYFITAQLDNAGAADTVVLNAFQITYLRS
ncbi:MAG: hypothetical protein R3C14_10710 [Caldilineaceae bacterium]